MATAPGQPWRQKRLDELAQHPDVGSRAALGRLLGYKDGAFVRQMIDGERPITEKTVERIETAHGGKFRNWFREPGARDTAPALEVKMPPAATGPEGQALALANAFARLPEKFADGTTRDRFYRELMTLISNRSARKAPPLSVPAPESTPGQAADQKTLRGKGRAARVAGNA